MKRYKTMTRSKHSVYRLDYHIVFVVKYRRPCITDEIGAFMVEEAKRVAALKGGKLLEGKSDKDHIHLLVSLPPSLNLSDFVGNLKMCLSRMVRRRYADHLKEYLWSDAFWSSSYYIASAGGAGLDTISQYIQQQGTKPRTKRVLRKDPDDGPR